MQVDPRLTLSCRAWSQGLKPNHDESLSKVAFNFNLRRYTVVADALARVHTQPGLMLKLREHLQHPALLPPLRGRGLHSSTSQLNLSALYGTGGARRGCVARVGGVLGGV